MRKALAACLCAATLAASPALPQSAEEPIPVPQDARGGSSGPSGASMEVGSGALAIVGFVTLLAIAAGAVVISNN